MIAKSTRPGILVIPDAGLKLRKDDTAEIMKMTPQVEAALKRGFLVEIEDESALNDSTGADQSNEKAGLHTPKTSAEELGGLNANEAIARVGLETDPTVLEGLLGSEKRKTVLDALKQRLQDIQHNDAE